MSGTKDSTQNTALAATGGETDLVQRSEVPEVSEYTEYREYLRFDFFHCCAYCTMSEAEAASIRFAIDHYEPRKARPDLVKTYSNLMYTCDPCNLRKGDRSPPSDARAAGFRFFRADQDYRAEHFEADNQNLRGKTPTGEYTIDALDLNRTQLRKLRDLRDRLTKCAPLVAEGVRGLRNFQYDQLPTGIRGQAVKAASNARHLEEKLANDIDGLLRGFARSPLIDPENGPDVELRKKQREASLNNLESLFPGNWRAPRS